jgi:SAM-dependent methyltransferase
VTGNPFATSEMALGYARSRPPVHPQVIERVLERLKPAAKFRRALDIGCGAGLSTAPLERLAEQSVGMEPAASMLAWTSATAPHARFLVGRAEAIPLGSASIDLMAAAGSLNYVDLAAFFDEASRVLEPGGMLLVYDFSAGGESRESAALGAWFQEFFRRHPAPEGEAGEITTQKLLRPGFRLRIHEDFEIGLPMKAHAYLDYMLTETNVAKAVREGAALAEIRAWCRTTLDPVFAGGPLEVLFRGYFTCLDRTAG